MLKQLNLHTDISKISARRLVAATLEKKKFVPTRRKRRQAIYAKVKAASYDKIYAIASKGSSKQNVQQHLTN
jgi:polyribonucleotide nucleotidyltransferase